MPSRISRVITLGGGSAGCLAALTLKRKLPWLDVTIIRSPDIGIIGVGEGTTPNFVSHFHGYLGLPRGPFYAQAEPTWKLGIRFEWGPRPHFNYTFAGGFASRWRDLPKSNGYYIGEGAGMDYVTLEAQLMDANRIFERQPNGVPTVKGDVPYHIENKKLVAYLEARCSESGVKFIDATVTEVIRSNTGIDSLRLDSGDLAEADLFVDASGFRSVLLGQTLHEPYDSYADTLFCDRAVIGGWERRAEPIQPYTTAETMDAGWCWRIDHERFINRGYVYSSAFISDSDAEAEFRRKNPAVTTTRKVLFRSGVYRRTWVDNVFAVGNAAGFVEPLEATALMVICGEMQALASGLEETDGEPTETLRKIYNRFMGGVWEEIRDFLAVHYRFNTRLDTPFWQHCREETPLRSAAEIVEYYRENGPGHAAQVVLVRPGSAFGINGYLSLLYGQQAPTKYRYTASPAETATWQRHCGELQERAQRAADTRTVFQYIRDPRWQWNA